MPATIRIKRSSNVDAPSNLKVGEIAYSYAETSKKLFIGIGPEVNVTGDASRIATIGGEYFTSLFPDNPGIAQDGRLVLLDDSRGLDYLKLQSLVGDSGSFNNLSVDSAYIRFFNADSAVIKGLISDSAHITFLEADSAYIHDLRSDSAYIQFADIDSSHIDNLRVDSAYIRHFDMDSGHIDNVSIDSAHIKFMDVDSGHVDNLTIDSAYIKYADIDSGHIDNVSIDSAYIKYADIDSGHIDNVSIDSAYIKYMDVDSGHIDNVSIDSAYIKYADIDSAYINDVTIDSAYIKYALIDHTDIDSADIGQVDIDSAYISRADIDSAYVGQLMSDSAKITYAHIETSYQPLITGPADIVIDPSAIDSNSGRVIIKGDLQVDGIQTIINSTTVSVNDKNIILADSAMDSAAADGAGITVFSNRSYNSPIHGRGSFTYQADASGFQGQVSPAPGLWKSSLPMEIAGGLHIGGKLSGVDSAHIARISGSSILYDSGRIGQFVSDSAMISELEGLRAVYDLGYFDKIFVDSMYSLQLTPHGILSSEPGQGRLINDDGFIRTQNRTWQDHLGSLDGIHFGKETVNGKGPDPTADSSYYHLTLTKSGNIFAEGFRIGGDYHKPTGQSASLTLNYGSQTGRGTSYAHDFYGLELNDSQLTSTLQKNVFKSDYSFDSATIGGGVHAVLYDSVGTPGSSLISLKGALDSNLISFHKDGSIDFYGNMYRKGERFIGGGIFEKQFSPYDINDVFYLPTIREPGVTDVFQIGARIGIGTNRPAHAFDFRTDTTLIGNLFQVSGRLNTSAQYYALNTVGAGSPSINDQYQIVVDLDSDKSRMMFDPAKARFRAGYFVTGTIKNTEMGTYSTAFGKNTIAKGTASYAQGDSSETYADGSFVSGTKSIINAGATTSIAIGKENIVSANALTSIAFGEGNQITSSQGIAIGKANTGVGDKSISIGDTQVTSGTGAVAIGIGNQITGSASIAIGGTSAAGNTVSATNSVALGFSHNIAGSYNFAFGEGITFPSTAQGSFAFGKNVNVGGDRSIGINLGTGQAGTVGEFIPLSNTHDNFMSIQGGNVTIGSDSDLTRMAVPVSSGVGNLYVTGDLIYSGENLKLLPDGTLLQNSPWSDNGLQITYTNGNKPIGMHVAVPNVPVEAEGNRGFIFRGNYSGSYTSKIGQGEPFFDSADTTKALSSFSNVSSNVSLMAYYPLGDVFRVGQINANADHRNDTIGAHSIGMGYFNRVDGDYGVVLGGDQSRVDGNYSVAIGGRYLKADGQYATNIGGYTNSTSNRTNVTGNYSSNFGGSYALTVGGTYNTNVGGYQNNMLGNYNIIAGGYINETTADAEWGAIVGGQHNDLAGDIGVIIGGYNNDITSASTTSGIFSSYSSAISGDYNAIIGGVSNSLSGSYGVIVGGQSVTISSGASTTGNASLGGYNINISGENNVSVGGYSNTLTGGRWNTTVGGRGLQITANANYSINLGGYNNDIDASYSANIAGQNTDIGTNANYSVNVGGYNTHIDAEYSVNIGGYNTDIGDASGNLSTSYSINIGGYDNKIGSSARTVANSVVIGGASGNPNEMRSTNSYFIGEGNKDSATAHSTYQIYSGGPLVYGVGSLGTQSKNYWIGFNNTVAGGSTGYINVTPATNVSENFIFGQGNTIHTTNGKGNFIIGRDVTLTGNQENQIILNNPDSALDTYLDNTKVAIGKHTAEYALDIRGTLRIGGSKVNGVNQVGGDSYIASILINDQDIRDYVAGVDPSNKQIEIEQPAVALPTATVVSIEQSNPGIVIIRNTNGILTDGKTVEFNLPSLTNIGQFLNDSIFAIKNVVGGIGDSFELYDGATFADVSTRVGVNTSKGTTRNKGAVGNITLGTGTPNVGTAYDSSQFDSAGTAANGVPTAEIVFGQYLSLKALPIVTGGAGTIAPKRFKSSVIIDSDLIVQGTVTLNDSVGIGKDLVVGGNLDVSTGYLKTGGYLDVNTHGKFGDSVTIGTSLDVGTTAVIGDSVQISGDLTVAGAVTLSGGIKTATTFKSTDSMQIGGRLSGVTNLDMAGSLETVTTYKGTDSMQIGGRLSGVTNLDMAGSLETVTTYKGTDSMQIGGRLSGVTNLEMAGALETVTTYKGTDSMQIGGRLSGVTNLDMAGAIQTATTFKSTDSMTIGGRLSGVTNLDMAGAIQTVITFKSTDSMTIGGDLTVAGAVSGVTSLTASGPITFADSIRIGGSVRWLDNSVDDSFYIGNLSFDSYVLRPNSKILSSVVSYFDTDYVQQRVDSFNSWVIYPDALVYNPNDGHKTVAIGLTNNQTWTGWNPDINGGGNAAYASNLSKTGTTIDDATDDSNLTLASYNTRHTSFSSGVGDSIGLDVQGRINIRTTDKEGDDYLSNPPIVFSGDGGSQTAWPNKSWLRQTGYIDQPYIRSKIDADFLQETFTANPSASAASKAFFRSLLDSAYIISIWDSDYYWKHDSFNAVYIGAPGQLYDGTHASGLYYDGSIKVAINKRGDSATHNLDLRGNARFEKNLLVEDSVTIAGSLSGVTSLDASGPVTFADSMQIGGSLSGVTRLTTSDSAFIGGNLHVESDLTIGGGLTTIGFFNIDSFVNIGGAVKIGSFNGRDSGDGLGVYDASQIKGKNGLYVGDSTHLRGGLKVLGHDNVLEEAYVFTIDSNYVQETQTVSLNNTQIQNAFGPNDADSHIVLSFTDSVNFDFLRITRTTSGGATVLLNRYIDYDSLGNRTLFDSSQYGYGGPSHNLMTNTNRLKNVYIKEPSVLNSDTQLHGAELIPQNDSNSKPSIIIGDRIIAVGGTSIPRVSNIIDNAGNSLAINAGLSLFGVVDPIVKLTDSIGTVKGQLLKDRDFTIVDSFEIRVFSDLNVVPGLFPSAYGVTDSASMILGDKITIQDRTPTLTSRTEIVGPTNLFGHVTLGSEAMAHAAYPGYPHTGSRLTTHDSFVVKGGMHFESSGDPVNRKRIQFDADVHVDSGKTWFFGPKKTVTHVVPRSLIDATKDAYGHYQNINPETTFDSHLIVGMDSHIVKNVTATTDPIGLNAVTFTVNNLAIRPGNDFLFGPLRTKQELKQDSDGIGGLLGKVESDGSYNGTITGNQRYVDVQYQVTLDSHVVDILQNPPLPVLNFLKPVTFSKPVVMQDSLSVKFVDADSASIDQLISDSAYIKYARIDSSYISQLIVDSSTIGHLIVTDSATIKQFTSDSAKISQLDADSAYIKILKADQILDTYISQLLVDSANIGQLDVDSAYIKQLKWDVVDSAYIKYAQIDDAYVSQLLVDSARISQLDVDSAYIKTAKIDSSYQTLIRGPSEITIDPLDVGTNTGKIHVKGSFELTNGDFTLDSMSRMFVGEPVDFYKYESDGSGNRTTFPENVLNPNHENHKYQRFQHFFDRSSNHFQTFDNTKVDAGNVVFKYESDGSPVLGGKSFTTPTGNLHHILVDSFDVVNTDKSLNIFRKTHRLDLDSHIGRIVDSDYIGIRLQTPWKIENVSLGVQKKIFYDDEGAVIIGPKTLLTGDLATRFVVDSGNVMFLSNNFQSGISTGAGGAGIADNDVSTVIRGNVPNKGAEARFMWIPQRGALRIGALDGFGASNYWEDSEVGYQSIAIGNNTKASHFSTALGFDVKVGEVKKSATTASKNNNNSVALGQGIDMPQRNSVAMGIGIIARPTNNTSGTPVPNNPFIYNKEQIVSLGSKINSAGAFNTSLGNRITIGYNVGIANDQSSFPLMNPSTANNVTAIGRDLLAYRTSDRSLMIGANSVVKKEDTTSIGNNNQLDKQYTIAIGNDNLLQKEDALAVGQNIIMRSSAKGAVGVGKEVTVHGKNAVAMGRNVHVTSGTGAVAIGADGKATGTGGVFVGSQGTASSKSVAVGSSVFAGSNGVAIGKNVRSHGSQGSIALGYNAYSGSGGFAIGNNVVGKTGAVMVGQGNSGANYSTIFGLNSTSKTGGVAIGSYVQNTGNYAVAMGRSVQAAGATAAMGIYVKTLGARSVAIGGGTSALPNVARQDAVSIGYSNDAGSKSVVIGKNNTMGAGTSSIPGITVGTDNTNNSKANIYGSNNSGNSYVSVYGSGQSGASTSSTNTPSTAMVYGIGNTITANGGLAFGKQNVVELNGLAFGSSNDVQKEGLAFGYDNEVNLGSGNSNTTHSIAFGRGNTSDTEAIALGRNNIATHGAIAIGNTVTATGAAGNQGGIGLGRNITVYGQNALGLGTNITVGGAVNSAANSVGIGLGTTATTVSTDNTLSIQGGQVVIEQDEINIVPATAIQYKSAAAYGSYGDGGTDITCEKVNENGRAGTKYALEVNGPINVNGTDAAGNEHDFYMQGMRLYNYIRYVAADSAWILTAADQEYVEGIINKEYLRTTCTNDTFFQKSPSGGASHLVYKGANDFEFVGINLDNSTATLTPGYLRYGPDSNGVYKTNVNYTLDVNGNVNLEGLTYQGDVILPTGGLDSNIYLNHYTNVINYQITPDSATEFFDSAYVAERYSFGANPSGADSSAIIEMIDEDYINDLVRTAWPDSAYINDKLDSVVGGDIIAFRVKHILSAKYGDLTTLEKALGRGEAQFTNPTGFEATHGTKVGIGKISYSHWDSNPSRVGVQTQLRTSGVTGVTAGQEAIETLGPTIGNLTTGTGLAVGGKVVIHGTQEPITGAAEQPALEIFNGHIEVNGEKLVLETPWDEGASYTTYKSPSKFIGVGKLSPSFTFDVNGKINADSGFFIDGTNISEIYDSDWVKTTVTEDYVKTELNIDSAYIMSTHKAVGDIIPALDTIYDLGSPTERFRDIYLSGNSISLGEVIISSNASGLELSDSAGNLLKFGGIDSDAISHFIDSSYVQLRADSNWIFSAVTQEYVRSKADSNYIKSFIDSAYVFSITDGKYDSALFLSAADSDYVKTVASSGYVLGIADSNYVKTFINSAYVLGIADSNYLKVNIDSSYIKGIITPAYVKTSNNIDSAFIKGIADSNHIQSAADSNYLKTHIDSSYVKGIADSSYVKGFIDSAYVFNITDTKYDSAFILSAADSAYVTTVIDAKLAATGHILPELDSAFDLGSPTKKFKDLYLSGSTINIGNTRITAAPAGLKVTDNAGNSAKVLGIDSDAILGFVDSAYVDLRVPFNKVTIPHILGIADSSHIKTHADSNYVKTFIDSEYVKGIADSGYIQGFISTPYIRGIIDSAHINPITGIGTRDVDFGGNTIYYNNTFAFTNQLPSATTYKGMVVYDNQAQLPKIAVGADWHELARTSDIRSIADSAAAALVASAPAALDTLNELAAAIGDDANFSTTLTNSIAAKLPLSGGTMTGAIDMGSNNITTTGKMLYSNVYSVEGDLPSASTYHGMFAHVHGTGKGYFAHAGNWVKLANFDDISSTVDSAYVQARQTSGGGGSVDSASIIALVDSAYVQARQTSGGGSGSFTSTITSYYYTATSNQTVFTGSDQNSNTLNYSVNSVTVFLNGINLLKGVDYNTTSSSTITLINAANSGDEIVINALSQIGASTSTINSAVSSVVDSAYVAARVTAGTDSASIINMIDSAYVAARSSSSGGGLTISDNPPASPSVGSMWFDPEVLETYVYYTDSDNTSQWVKSNPTGIGISSVTTLVDSAYVAARTTAGAANWTEITSTPITATANQRLIIDTSTAKTINLPVSANLGDEIRFIDGTGNANTNNITINRNGHKIEASDSDLTIDVDRAAFGLVYYNVANGWLFTEK